MSNHYASRRLSSAAKALVIVFMASFAGCSLWQSQTGEEHPFTSAGVGAATGAAVGAVGGAIIGSTSGNVGSGLAVGSLAGAAVGGALGYRVSENEKEQSDKRSTVTRQDAQIKRQRHEIRRLRDDLSDEANDPLMKSGRPSVVKSVADWRAYRGSPAARPVASGRAMMKPSFYGENTGRAVTDLTLVSPPSIPAKSAVKSADATPAVSAETLVVSPSLKATTRSTEVPTKVPTEVPTEVRRALPATKAGLAVVTEKSLEQVALENVVEPIKPTSALPPMKSELTADTEESTEVLSKQEDEVVGEPDDALQVSPKDEVKQALKTKLDAKSSSEKPQMVAALAPVSKAAASTKVAEQQKLMAEVLNTESCVKAREESDRAKQSKSVADRLFYYRRALRLCPESSDYHFEIGKLYSVIGRTEDAKEEFRQALARNSANDSARHELSLLEKE